MLQFRIMYRSMGLDCWGLDRINRCAAIVRASPRDLIAYAGLVTANAWHSVSRTRKPLSISAALHLARLESFYLGKPWPEHQDILAGTVFPEPERQEAIQEAIQESGRE